MIDIGTLISEMKALSRGIEMVESIRIRGPRIFEGLLLFRGLRSLSIRSLGIREVSGTHAFLLT